MASLSGEGSRIAKMLKETVILLCENSLSFTAEVHVQALLAITVDHSTMFSVQLDEKLVKNRESVESGVSSGSDATQGRVLSQQRPAVARRLALPAPPVSSPAAQPSSYDSAGLAWPLPLPQAARPVRTRGPRFPVGRGRGMVRGGRGRGGAVVRGGAPAMRMIRTAVSSVRFPMSQSRMQAPHRAVRPAGVRPPVQRLALPPAVGGSAGSSPRQVPTAVIRQRAAAPVRQSLSSGSVPNSMSQAMVRKPSPRLALMPPTQSSSTGSAAFGLRQQSPSMLPRQAGSVRGASPRGRGRPRLAIMPPPPQQSSSNSQSLVLRSPSQPRAMPRQSSPRLALMPPPQSPVKSPHGIRQQTATALRQTSPARSQIQLVARQQSPAVMKQESNPSLSPHNLPRLASQLSSSSVGTQVHAVVEHLLKQQRQSSPVAQNMPTKSHAAVAKPAALPVPHTVAIRPAHSAAVNSTTAATLSHVIAVNMSPAGNRMMSSVTQSPRTPSQLVHDAARFLNLLSSPQQSAAMPTPVAVAQQRILMASPADKGSSAVVSCQPVRLAASGSSFNTSLHQPYLTTQSTVMSGVMNTHSNVLAQNNSIPGAQRFGVQTTQVATPPASELANAVLLSRAYFSPAELLPRVPRSPQQLSAVPLYSSPTQAAAVRPAPPPYRAGAGDAPAPQHPGGMLQKNVSVPGSPFAIDRAPGSSGCVTSVQGHIVMPPAGTTVKQLVLSPQSRLAPATVSHLQQHVVPQQQQQHASSSASQPPFMSSLFMGDVTRFLSPSKSHTSDAVLQQRSQNSPQVSSVTQSQISASHMQRLNQTPQQVAPAGQNQLPAAYIQQIRQNLQPAASLQGDSSALQQYVVMPQGVVTPMSVASLQQVSQNREREDQKQKHAPVHQLMQYRQQATVSTAIPMSPVSLQRGQILLAQQPQLAASQSSPRMTVQVSHKSHDLSSLSQTVAQAVASGRESDQRAVLELIKQQAFQQLCQGKQPSVAQHRTVAAASCSDQAAPSHTSRQVPLTSVSQQSSAPQQSSCRGGPMTPLSFSQQRPTATLSHAMSPSIHQQIQVSEQSNIQQTVTSNHLPSMSLGFPRPTVPGVSSRVVAPSPQQQAVLTTSSRSEQVVPSTVQRQPQMSEPTTPQPTCSRATISTPQRHVSHTSISDESISVVSSSSAVSQCGTVSAVADAQHSTQETKEKLLKLKEKIQKTGSVERDRLEIISSLQSGAATTADAQLSSSESTVVQSASNTSVTGYSELGE